MSAAETTTCSARIAGMGCLLPAGHGPDHEGIRYGRLETFSTASVRLIDQNDREALLAAGQPEWALVPFLTRAACEHDETMCLECADEWRLDYEVVLP